MQHLTSFKTWALMIALTGLVVSQPVATGIRGATLTRDSNEIASISEALPDVWRFVNTLSADVRTGSIGSMEQFIERCRKFYTAEQMARIEGVLPGWTHMSSFADGKTLWHINLAMVALLQLDEYRSMKNSDQTVQEWVVLLHDVAKEPVDGRDHRHCFRSAAQAGQILPKLGFPVTAAYSSEFQNWFNVTDNATRFDQEKRLDIQDNSKLPSIFAGSRRIFAEPTRAAVSAIALHQSITTLAAWPVKAPLTDDEVIAYVDDDVFPVLMVLTMADSGGWNLFDQPTLEAMYQETRTVFRNLRRTSSD